MARYIAQGTSSNVVIGPMVNISGTLLSALAIANNQIVLVKEGSVSAARSDATSAVSVGPGLYRIGLNATDTDTMGTLVVYVSASAALQYAINVEIWQAATHALYYGSAQQILTSAAASAIVSVGVNTALVNYDVASSADVSAIVSAVISGVLNSYNVASAGEVASAGISSAGVSAIVQTALTNYDAATSADVSAILAGIGGVSSAAISGIVAGALTNYDVATSADVSTIVANLGGISSAQVSVIVAGVLTNYDVPTSADVSAIVEAVAMTSGSVSSLIATVLTNYDVPNPAFPTSTPIPARD